MTKHDRHGNTLPRAKRSQIAPKSQLDNLLVPTGEELDKAEAEALATDTITKIIEFNGQDAWLDGVLLVKRDCALSCRLGYTTNLFLKYTDEDGIQHYELVGFINSWRISKPTSKTGQGIDVGMPWSDELLSVYEQEGNVSDHGNTSLCMQALFDEIGNPRSDLSREVQDSLRNRRLMFVELVYLRPDFQRQGLIDDVIPLWHRLLHEGGLPEWYSFSGQIVLAPSRPDNAYGEHWEGSKDDQVESTIAKVFRKHGYQTWQANQPVTYLRADETKAEYLIQVMGRSLP